VPYRCLPPFAFGPVPGLSLVHLTLLVCLLPVRLAAQDERSSLGLTSVGAVAAFGGAVWLERHSRGQEGGASIDLGWLRGRRVRLQGEVSMVRGTLTEYVLVEDSTYRGPIYDLDVASWPGSAYTPPPARSG
jgi:hypothetical protein